MKLVSQSCVSAVHSSEILWGKLGREIGSLMWFWISFQMEHQGVDQILESPFWFWTVQFSIKMFFTWQMDDQKADLMLLSRAVQKLALGKCLALRISVRNWFLPVATFQASWRMRLLLTVSRSLIPRSPSFFGLQMSHQDLKWNG